MSKINDGMNDVLLVSGDKPKKCLFNMLLAADDGNKYFKKSKNKAKHGMIDPSTGLQYLKTDEWELKPDRKGPVPDGI